MDLEHLGVGDVGRAGEALDGAVLLLPGDDLGDVEPGRVVDAAGRVGDGDDGRALLDRSAAPRSSRRCRSPGPTRSHFVRSMPRWRLASMIV